MGKKKRNRGAGGGESASPVQGSGPLTAALFANKALLWWLPILYLLISDSFYLRTYDSAQVKISLVQMGGICMLALWLARLLDEGKGVFSRNDLVTLAPFLAYFAYGIFSYLHSPYRVSSTDFFLRRIFYMTVPLIIIREFHEEGINRLTRILILTTWITVGYGMLQWFDTAFFPPGIGKGPDPFIWRGAFGERVFSTFGNPNFFADFLVLIFPILVFQYLKNREIKLIPLILMLLWTLYSTVTKGAWIGFTITLSLTIATYGYFLNQEMIRKYWKHLGLALLVLAGGVGGMVVHKLNHSRWVSVNFRLFTWEGTWEMIRTQPVIGTGIGSFWVIYPAFRRPPIFHIEGKHNTETDHSENEWLEVLYDEGILGFGIFIWLIVSACFVGYGTISQLTTGLKKGQRAPPRVYDIMGYMVAMQGMLAHNVFDVSMRFVSSGIYLGLLSGLVVNLSRGVSLAEVHEVGHEPGKGAETGKGDSIWGLVSSFLIWPARLGAWGGLAWIAWTLVTEFSKLQGPLAGMNLGGEILQWWIAWGCFLLCVGSQGYIFARTALLTRNPLVPVLVGLMVFPLHYTWGFFKADVHHNIAIFFSKKKDWENALKNYLIVGSLNPAFVMSFYFKGNVFNDRFHMDKVYNPNWGDTGEVPRDDFERAMEAYGEVRAAAPNYVQMHHQVGNLFLKRSDWERGKGRTAEAEKFLDLALEKYKLYQMHDPVFAPNFYRMAQIYMLRKDYDAAIKTLTDLIEAPACAIDPDIPVDSLWHRTVLRFQDYADRDGKKKHIHPSTEAYTQLANAFFFKGDLRSSELNYKEALKLDPENQGAARNLQILYNRARQVQQQMNQAAPPGR